MNLPKVFEEKMKDLLGSEYKHIQHVMMNRVTMVCA